MRNDNQMFGKRRRKFLPKGEDRFKAEEIPQPHKSEQSTIFLFALLTNLVFAYLFKYFWILGSNDAIRQTSKSLYLLYSQSTSPLSSIILIHPPLPIFFQLIPVPMLRLINAAAFSGPFLSSLFGAGVLLILNRILLVLRVHDRYRWILLLLTQLYPSFLFAAAAGTADMAHVFFVLIVLWGAMLINRQQMAFLVSGLGITLGFFVQYRIASMLFSVFLGLIILKWNLHEDWQEELEGWLLAFLTPPLYAIGLWLLLNWMNQNNPFYFIFNLLDPIQAPSIARNVGGMHPYFLGWDNFIESFSITAVNIWETSLLFFFGSGVTVFLAFFFKRRRYIANLGIILTLPATLALLIFLGILPPWQYLWITIIPLSMILACQAYQDLKPAVQNWWMLGIIVITLGSMWINYQALGKENSSPSEQRFYAIIKGDQFREIALRESDPYWVFQHDAPIVANALAHYSDEGKILVDGTVAAPILVNSQHLDRMIILKNLTIPNIVSPESAQADYILTLIMEEPLNTSTLAYASPQFEDEDINWASQVWSSNETILDWRIFRLNLDKAD